MDREDIPQHSRPRRETAQAATSVTDPSREAAQAGEQPRTVWSSERAFVLSTAAAGVGLGNLWRFPTMVGENGGAVFLLAYAIAVVCVGIPFAALEVAAGRMAHGSTVASFRHIAGKLVWLGWAVVLLTLMIDSYYFVVTGWTLGYAVESTLGAAPAFDAFTSGYASVWYLLAVGGLVAGVLLFGLSGIERFARVMMPLLVAAVLGLAVFGLTNGGAGAALAFLFSPDLGQLAHPAVWRDAFGQAFYSLTIGQGYLITYGSYLPPRIHVARSVASIAAINSTVAILAGLAIFPLVFAAGLDPGAGSELAFTTLPEAFRAIGAEGILAPLFFWLFFLAAFSSCLGGAKVVTAALREKLRAWGPRASILAGLGMITLLGLPSALSYAAPGWTLGGRPVLDFMDRMLGTNAVLAAALASALALGWVLAKDRWHRQFGQRHPSLTTAFVWLARLAPLGLGALFLVGALTR